MNQKNENQNSNTPYIPRILRDSGLNITFHSIDPNTNIQSEKSVLPNGTYEKRFKDGVLIESISIIKNIDGGWVETHFNPQGERTALGHYQKDGVPTKMIHFKNEQPVEITTFERIENNILISRTFNNKDELIYGAEYDENYQVKNAVYLEHGKIIQTQETEIDEKENKIVTHKSFKDNTMLINVDNKEGEGIGEYHYENDKLIRSLEVRTDENGYKHVKVWDANDPAITSINIFPCKGGPLLAKRIYKDGTYIGLIEYIRDSTTNHYEVFFDANGNKVSCSTYNQKNELIEKGFYINGIYQKTRE